MRFLVTLMVLAACSSNRGGRVADPVEPGPEETPVEKRGPSPSDTAEHPYVDQNGVKSWQEGDVAVVAVNSPLWCRSHFDDVTKTDTTECFLSQAGCQRTGDGCESHDNAACVAAKHVLDGNRILRCYASMQMCGEQWIMLSGDVDYADVQRCGVARYLGR